MRGPGTSAAPLSGSRSPRRLPVTEAQAAPRARSPHTSEQVCSMELNLCFQRTLALPGLPGTRPTRPRDAVPRRGGGFPPTPRRVLPSLPNCQVSPQDAPPREPRPVRPPDTASPHREGHTALLSSLPTSGCGFGCRPGSWGPPETELHPTCRQELGERVSQFLRGLTGGLGRGCTAQRPESEATRQEPRSHGQEAEVPGREGKEFVLPSPVAPLGPRQTPAHGLRVDLLLS